jgi:hypothetical protein
MEEVEYQKAKDSIDMLLNIQIKTAKKNILSTLMKFFGGIAAAAVPVYAEYRIM